MDANKRNRMFFLAMTITFSIIVLLYFFSSNTIVQAKDLNSEKEVQIFLEVMEFVQNYYVDEEKVDTKTLMAGAMKGMMESLDDPYSVYLSKSDMEDMEETTVGKFGGVGLYILEVEEGIEVARPIAGTPAYRAGISAGDIIIIVDDESVVDLNIDEVIDRLKGEPGTPVKMTVLRGKSKTLDFTVIRELIEIPTVRKDIIKKDIAYLKINQFTPLTYTHTKEALEWFEEMGYNSLIIDLRSNPGGLLSSVIEVSDLFFPPGKLIVYTKSRIKGENRRFKAKRKAVVPGDIPIAVLIDKYSASASEILTGVLKDHDRAIIVGDTSYGKGSVQQIRYAGDGGIKLTMAKYYTPSGVTIHNKGIEPDRVVTEKEFTDEEKESLNKLYESNKIEVFVNDTKKIDDTEIKKFITSLKEENIILEDRFVKRMIRNEINRTNNNPPAYDLDYDLALQEAVKSIEESK